VAILITVSGRSAVVAHLSWEQRVVSSNLAAPTTQLGSALLGLLHSVPTSLCAR
jgi:hypothetical protein